jgi:hypothetical protein
MQKQNEEIRARRDEAEKDLERFEEERKGKGASDHAPVVVDLGDA